MFKNYKTLQTIARVFALSAFVFAGIGTSFAQVDKDFEAHESKFKELVKEHKRELIKNGDDREARDQALRIANYRANLKQTTKKTNARLAATTETLANGKLIGQWIEKGATNIAGRVRNADYYAATGEVYAVSDGGNVWRGNLSGTSWACLNNNLKLKGADFIKVFANGSGKRIVVGTLDKYVYYSDNEGLTWNISNGLSSLLGWGWNLKTVVANDANSTIYLLSIEWTSTATVSVFKSVDKGANFTKVRSWLINYDNADQTKFNIWTPINATHDAAYVINKDSVFRVPASGNSTALFKHNLAIANDVRLTGQKTGSTINMYLATNQQLYATSNLGQTWTTLNAPTSNNPWGQNSLNVSLANANVIYFGDIEAYKGVRSGSSVTWTRVNAWGDYYPSPATKLHADIPAFVPITVSAAEQTLICTDGGLYKSTDGLATVTNLTMTGMNNAQYYSVYTNRNNTNYVNAGSQDQGFQQATVDGGGLLNFTEIIGGDNGRIVSTDHTSFWQTGYGDIYFYPNATVPTASWMSLGGIARLWMPYILEHPTNGNIMYMAGGRDGATPAAQIMKFTYDGVYGITKTNLPYNFATQSNCTNISGINISKINNNYWYVLTDNGRFFSSSDGGVNYTMNSTFVGPEAHYFYGSSIISSANTLGTLYIAGNGYNGNGVYKSTNHGASFTSITTGLPQTMIFDLAFNADETMVFAATEVGAYVYVVADNAWYPMIGSTGADQTYWDVEFIHSTNTARFATYGRGIWDFKVQSSTNLNPTVNLTSPTNNATFTALASIALSATAADADGSIAKVEFYNGTSLIGTVTASPYNYNWSNVAAGTYAITAKAYDNTTGTAVSSVANITVNAAGGCTEPQYVAGTTYATGVSVKNNGKKYQCTVGGWCSSPSAWAYEPGVGSAWQSAWTETGVCGGTNLNPTVSITSPANNAAYNAPASIAITATAADGDGTITKVEFFNGTTLLATVTSSPYTYTWANVADGSYTITAKATDNAGATTTSTGVVVNVNTLPTVSITSPVNNATFTIPASITITANAADANGTIAKVEFYNGTTLLNTDVSAPYSYTWTGVALGNYAITAKAYDNLNAVTTSSVVNITVNNPSNQAPAVSLTSPTNNATFAQPANVAIAATASDPDGSIAKVEFYNGATLLNADVTAPYAYSWAGVAAGTYAITAKAYDNIGAITTSTVVNITVTNQLPTVSLTSPTNNATFAQPATVTLTATAADADGTISKVEFYRGTTLITTKTSSPYTYSWAGVAAGTYAITAKAYDNSGAVTTSSVVNITVTNQLPTVTLTSPSNNASFAAPATVSLAATASDVDGTIAKVEFYYGTTLITTKTASPYTHSWTGVAAGTYAITAKAYDNSNAVVTSSIANITVTGSTCTAPVWSASTPYNGGAVVQYNGIKYIANWWTSGEQPDLNNGPVGSGKPWTSQGTCNSRIDNSLSVINQVLTLAPNPVENNATIYLNLPYDDEVSIAVVDRIGRDAVKVFEGKLKAGNYEYLLEVNHLPSGIYSLVLKGNNGNINLHFVKK